MTQYNKELNKAVKAAMEHPGVSREVHESLEAIRHHTDKIAGLMEDNAKTMSYIADLSKNPHDGISQVEWGMRMMCAGIWLKFMSARIAVLKQLLISMSSNEVAAEMYKVAHEGIEEVLKRNHPDLFESHKDLETLLDDLKDV